MLIANAAPAGNKPYIFDAANTVSSNTPIAPPCNASAKLRLLSRLRQANTSAASAAAEMPARRNSIGIRIQPWSLA